SRFLWYSKVFVIAVVVVDASRVFVSATLQANPLAPRAIAERIFLVWIAFQHVVGVEAPSIVLNRCLQALRPNIEDNSDVLRAEMIPRATHDALDSPKHHHLDMTGQPPLVS